MLVNDFEKLVLPIKTEIKLFEKKLKEIISAQDNFLKEDLLNFMFANPKRLRPIFVFLFAKILKINFDNLVYNIALALEIIHSASLVHDDILDEEELRRNYPTFYSKYGSKLAVLEGDLLLTLSLEVLSQTNLEILNIFSNRIKKTISGELNQASNIDKLTDIDSYYEKTLAKTANLFIAGVESLFCLADIEEIKKENIIEFMKNYALAFQIKNDIENILSKNSTDIKNGNYTLPVLYYFMENPQVNLVEINKENLKKYIDFSYQKVDEYKNKALNCLVELEKTAYKQSLIDLCNYTLRSEI